MSGGMGFGSSHAVGQKLGRYGMKRNQYAGNPFSTGYSTANQGQVTIDPSIRAMQDYGLANSRGLYGELGTMRNDMLGNNSAYIQARVNPLLQQQEARRGELRQNIGMRGLDGSSFGQQALTNFDTDTNRSIADQRALATKEGMDSAMQTFALQSSLNNENFDVAKARLNQELSALGMGEKQIELMSNMFEQYQRRMLNNLQDVQHQDNISYSGGGSDKGGMDSGGWCFVAVELYGDGEKTDTIRQFVGRHFSDKSFLGSFLLEYRDRGPEWANMIKTDKSLRELAELIWDRFYRMAVDENAD